MIKNYMVEINRKRNTIDLRNLENIIVYGAGKYAERFVLHCQLICPDKLQACIVSSMEGNLTTLLGVPIIAISECSIDFFKEKTVVVAVSKKYQDGVLEILSRIKVQQIFIIDEDMYEMLARKNMEILSKEKTVRNKIFFYVFLGKGYACNCKYIADEILKRNEDIEMVWGIKDGDPESIPPQIKVVKYPSIEFYREWYSAGVMVFNDFPDILVRDELILAILGLTATVLAYDLCKEGF